MGCLYSSWDHCSRGDYGDRCLGTPRRYRSSDPSISGRLQVTTSVLVESQAGKSLKKLAKSSNKTIADAARDVVEAWKKVVVSESGPKPEEGKQLETKQDAKPEAKPSQGGSQPGPAAAVRSSAEAGPSKPAKHALQVTGDAKRDSYINSMADILATVRLGRSLYLYHEASSCLSTPLGCRSWTVWMGATRVRWPLR